MVSWETDVSSHEADVPNGRGCLAERIFCPASLNGGKVSEGYLFTCLHIAVGSRELGNLGNGTYMS